MNLGGYYYSEEELGKAGFKHIGKNVKIHNRASIYGTENITIGDNVRIDDFTIIIATGPLVLGSYVSIHNFCFIGSKYGVRLDDFVTFAPGVKVFSSSDDYSGECMTGVMVPPEYTGGDKGQVTLGRHVIVGAGSIILPGCMLGEGVAVGSLSMVKSSLDPWWVYSGIPAKKIKPRNKEILRFEQKMKGLN